MTLIPTQVTFHGLPHSDALEADVRERMDWLERFYKGLVRCHVVIERPHRHRHSGDHFRVRIELTMPDRAPLVVDHEPSTHGSHKDIEAAAHRKDSEIEAVRRYARVAVHDAFDTARRRLQDEAREQRGAVKAHEAPLHGQVVELSIADGFGFIEERDRRLYFNQASVLDGGFTTLTVGSRVVFVEEKGDKGPQASSVRLLGKHHYSPA